ISREDLGLPASLDASPMALNLREVRQAAESSAITRALSLSDGNLSNAAKLLGVSRPTLYDLMGKYGMVVPGE
ncbi:MAG: helix-turn-helix domain-containing protein, partial [Gammaproteobacteria bacterium]